MFTCLSVLLSILITVVLYCILPSLHKVKAPGSYTETFSIIKSVIRSSHWLRPVFERTHGCFAAMFTCVFVLLSISIIVLHFVDIRSPV